MQKARRHPFPEGHRAPTACRHVVSGSVSSPYRGSSQLSLALLIAIGHQRVFSLGRWSSPLRTHFHVLSRTQDAAKPPPMSPTGLSPVSPPIPGRSAMSSGLRCGPTTPAGIAIRFGLVPVRSPLLRESRLLSLPPGNEMFQFPGLARVSRDQDSFGSSPVLIAVFHALQPSGA